MYSLGDQFLGCFRKRSQAQTVTATCAHNSAPSRRIFAKFDSRELLVISLEKTQTWLKLDDNNKTFHMKNQRKFTTISSRLRGKVHEAPLAMSA